MKWNPEDYVAEIELVPVNVRRNVKLWELQYHVDRKRQSLYSPEGKKLEGRDTPPAQPRTPRRKA